MEKKGNPGMYDFTCEAIESISNVMDSDLLIILLPAESACLVGEKSDFRNERDKNPSLPAK